MMQHLIWPSPTLSTLVNYWSFLRFVMFKARFLQVIRCWMRTESQQRNFFFQFSRYRGCLICRISFDLILCHISYQFVRKIFKLIRPWNLCWCNCVISMNYSFTDLQCLGVTIETPRNKIRLYLTIFVTKKTSFTNGEPHWFRAE